MRALPFEAEAVAEAKRKKRNVASVPVIHLRKALRLGLLDASDPEAIVRVAANAMQTEARCRGKEFGPEDALRFLRLYRVPVALDRLDAIIAEEDRYGSMTVEERGERLNLSKEDRLAHEVYMIGAQGETKEQREAARDKRQRLRAAAKNERSRAERAATRDPLHVNISKAAQSLGLDRRKVRELHNAWMEEVRAGCETAMHISEPCKEFLLYAAHVCTKSVSRAKPWEEQGLRRATYYRRKANGNPAGEVEPALRPAESKRPAPIDTEPVSTKAGRKLALPNRPDVTNVVVLPFYDPAPTAASAVQSMNVAEWCASLASSVRQGIPTKRGSRRVAR